MKIFPDVSISLSSIKTIDTCIRKETIGCLPVLEKLIEKMQKDKLVCFDETSGHEKDLLK